eukprot:719527-Alexandrium_andersonii.AAC.1
MPGTVPESEPRPLAFALAPANTCRLIRGRSFTTFATPLAWAERCPATRRRPPPAADHRRRGEQCATLL